MTTDLPDRLACRRAIEALRNGVPNREAVRSLGSTQPEAEQEFQSILDSTSTEGGSSGRGLLISGGFGTGKSHLLEYLEHRALEQNFVCSRVAVSKETPFYDLGRMFRSAVDHGAIPGGTVGPMIDEIGLGLDTRSDGYARFFQWANAADDDLHRIFPATLMLHERLQDMEMTNAIRWFWSGDKLAVGAVKQGLRQIQQHDAYRFSAPKQKDLPPQRLRFALRMIEAAGYRGWIVLIDELELIGSYSLLQRARSYAELARWMGDTDDELSGLVVVAAITDDFAEVILEQKGDRMKVPARMRERGDEWTAQRAERGIEWLASRRTELREVTPDAERAAVDKIRQIYSSAYQWPAPAAPATSGAGGYQKRMRYKVRSAITTWDLQRLYPDSRPDLQTEEYRADYAEDRDLEVTTREDD